MTILQNRLPYLPPELDIYDYVVEKGFARTNTFGVTSGSQDQWSEINNFTESSGGGFHAGENQTGDWLDDTEW